MNIGERVDAATVSPASFMPGRAREKRDAVDRAARDYFSDMHGYFCGKGLGDYHLRRLEASATVVLPLLVASGLPLERMTALEIGCGQGLKAFPVARHLKQYVGVDLESDSIVAARRTAADLRLGNLLFVCDNAKSVLEQPERYGIEGRIGILLLHAVLEHLTGQERGAVMEVARQVRAEGGAVAVLETPNRLFPFDHHSSQLHFVDACPDSIALRYVRKYSPRNDARTFVDSRTGANELSEPWLASQRSVLLSSKDPIERFYRLGRGLSYHDFDLDYCDAEAFSPVYDGWHPLLLNHQPLTRTEVWLENYFAANSVGAHRAFARSWIDFFDLPGAARADAPRARYIEPRTVGVARVERRKEFWSLDGFYFEGMGSLVFDVPRANGNGELILLLECIDEHGSMAVEIDGANVEEISFEDLARKRPRTWHKDFALPISVPPGAGEVRVCALGSSRLLIKGGVT